MALVKAMSHTNGAQFHLVPTLKKLIELAFASQDISMKRDTDAKNSTHVKQTLVKMKEFNPNVLIFHLRQEITKQDDDVIALTGGVDLIA